MMKVKVKIVSYDLKQCSRVSSFKAALCTSDDGGSVLQQLTDTVLMYALSEEEEGWRVWVESMSTLHTYVSYYSVHYSGTSDSGPSQ